MTTFRSEEGLVGLLSLAIVPWIGWTIVRGLRERRLPVGRGHIVHAERPAAFGLLLLCYLAGAAMLVFIGLDLLIDE